MAIRNNRDKKENIPIIIVVLLVLLVLGFGGGFGMGGMMFFGPFFMVLVLGLIVWLIVALTNQR